MHHSKERDYSLASSPVKQYNGHRKNNSQTMESKDYSISNLGTPKEQKHQPTAKFENTPSHQKKYSYDAKAKTSTSASNLRNILTTSHGHQLSNPTSLSTASHNISLKSSTNYNHATQTPNKTQIFNQSENNQSGSALILQNQTAINFRENESQPLSPIEEVQLNNVKRMPPLSTILSHQKYPAEIPRSSFNFNIDQFNKKSVTQATNNTSISSTVNQILQRSSQDISYQQLGQNKSPIKPQTPSQSIQQSANYFQKSSYLPVQSNQTPSTSQFNSQMSNNMHTKTNTNQLNQSLQLQQQEVQYFQGSNYIDSQKPSTTNAPSATSQLGMISGESSMTNISIQPDNHSAGLKSDEQILPGAGKLSQISEQSYKREDFNRKEERSVSRDQQKGSKKDVSPTKILNKKDSLSSNSTRNTPQKKYHKSSIQINLGIVNQQSTGKTTPKQGSAAASPVFNQNTGEIKLQKNTSYQYFEEARKHSALPSHLGIKNTNINLATINSSANLGSSQVSQAPPYTALNTNQSLQNSTISVGQRISDMAQPLPFQQQPNLISQFRKESLVGFQMNIPKLSQNNSQVNFKNISKQVSSVLLNDSEEGSQIQNESSTYTQQYQGRNPNRSQTQLNASPGRASIMGGLQKSSYPSQKSIAEISPKINYNKRNTEYFSPTRQSQGSPTKSLFQMVRMAVNDGSSPLPMNSSQKFKKKRLQSILISDNKERSGNVKTVLRFRPNNTMEMDLNNQGLGQNIIQFIDDYSVSIAGDTQNVYTVDRIYRSYDPQELIYNQVGKEVIEDVFLGYNGTIFTYGVTGSGKTHTMFGKINDPDQMGIIPRISNQIFDLVQNDEDGTEFIINCSMLEIYKEILYDSFQEGKQELKIKENAQKGIYVQGLTQTSIASQEELVQIIDLGYNTKRTRETRLNEYSSRSHTIFMIEIQQRLPNGDEKIGKINLIDLAGAEKVSRSGAQGESLEEAIKINLSLSCLGKVIHSLTSGNEYIPYRDSKLTRILQESLGGNYKTSLIVTCSMHSSFQDDTISTLKFATRAKTIKNTFKMNIKVNPINMQKELETLKMQTESYKYMLQNVKSIFTDAQNQLSSLPNSDSDPKLSQIKSKLDEFLSLQNMMDEYNGFSQQDIQNSSIDGKLDGKSLLNNLMANTKKDAIMIVKDENIKQLQQVNSEQSEQIQSLQSELQMLKRQNLNLTVKVNELSQENSQLNLKLNRQLSKNDFNTFSLEILQKQIQHLVDSVCFSEKKVSTTLQEKKNIIDKRFEEYLKEKLTFSEIKLNDYFKNSINFNFESAEKGYKDVQQNIKKFNLEGEEDFMGEKSMDIESSDLFEATETLIETGYQANNNQSNPQNKLNSLNNYNDVNSMNNYNNMNSMSNHNNAKSMNNYTITVNGNTQSNNTNNHTSNNNLIVSKNKRNSIASGSFVYNIVDTKLFQNENNDILKKIFDMPTKLDMISASDGVSGEFIIVSLKKQLIDSHILNQNLLRTVNALEWKQIIEYAKSKLKSDQIHIQKKHIQKLEKVLDEVTENHKELRLKIEDLEFDMFQQASVRPMDFDPNQRKRASIKNKIIIPVTPQNAQRNLLLKNENTKKSAFFDGLSKHGNNSRKASIDRATMQKELSELQSNFNDLELDIVPLTYDNALEELKKRNNFLKKLAELNVLDQDFNQAPQKESDEFIKNERERLNNKIVILQQELKMEQVKVESFKHSLLVERKNMKDMKQLNEEMEVSLRNNLKEENECWQRTINEITEQNKTELTKRQAEFIQLKEIFYSIIEVSLTKIQDLKQKWSSQEIQELESIIAEMDKAKQKIGTSYENNIKKRQRNSSIHSMALLTPKRPLQQQTTVELNSNGKSFQLNQ